MGFRSYDESEGFRGNLGQGIQAPDPNAPSLLGAAFRQANTVGSLGNWLVASGGAYEDEPGHNPLDLIKDTPYEARHLNAFVGSRSSAETRAVMRQIDGEEADKKVLSEAGWGGVVAQIGMGILDPTIALPGGALYRAGSTSWAAGKSAMSVAAWAAAGAAAQEAVLQPTQITRTGQDAAETIAFATVLGGILGAGASKFLSAAERTALNARFAEDAASGFNPQPASAGAAAADMRTGQLVGFGLDKVPWLGEVVRRFSPVRDVLQSESQASRRLMLDLAETALRTEDAAQGVAQTQGLAASRAITQEQKQVQMLSTTILDDAFQMHYFGDTGRKLGQDKAAFDAMRGAVPEGKVGPMEFLEEVGRAMRPHYESAIPEANEAAKRLRSEILDGGYWERLKKAGILPEDMTLEQQQSWLLRMWDVPQIIAWQDELIHRFTGWLGTEQVRKLGVKDKVETLDAARRVAADAEARVEAQLERIDRRLAVLRARGDERGMEATRTAGRAEATGDRLGVAAEKDSDIGEFLRDLEAGPISADLKARVTELQNEYRALSAAEERSRVTLDDLDRQRASEVAGALRDPETKLAAGMLTGERNWPKREFSLVDYVIKSGGINPDEFLRGEVKMLGESAKGAGYRGLVAKKGTGKTLDELAEAISELDAGRYGVDRYTPAEVVDMLDAAISGRNPGFFDAEFNVGQLRSNDPLFAAADWAEIIARESPVEIPTRPAMPKSSVVDDVARIAKEGGRNAQKRIADVLAADATKRAAVQAEQRAAVQEGKRIIAEFVTGKWDGMRDGPGRVVNEAIDALEREAAGVPLTIRLEATGEAITATKEQIAALKATLRKAEAGKASAETGVKVAGARADEARMAATVNEKRAQALAERLDAAERKQALLAEARDIARRAQDDAVAGIEEEIGRWGGKTAREALSSIKARDRASGEAAVGAAETLPRSRSADGDIVTAAKRIIESDPDLSPQELREVAMQIVDNIKGTPGGRLFFRDAETAGVDPNSALGRLRGPLARRAFQIPDEVIEGFLVNRADDLMRAYTRTVVPDLRLIEQFGSNDLKVQKQAVAEDFERMITAAPDAKTRAKLEAERVRTLEKIDGVLLRVRGVYGWSEGGLARNIGRIGTLVLALNMLADLGTAAFNSMADIANIIGRQGFMNTFSEGWVPFAKELAGIPSGFKESGRQLQSMGVASEVWHATHGRSLADLQSPFEPVSKFERGIYYAGEKFNLINLQAYWTDWAKTVAGTVTMNEMYRATKALTEGRATAKQIASLAESGIDADMARRIFDQFDASKDVIGTTHLPNTAKWTDGKAREIFEGALAREVEIAVVSPGQEKPLWMSRPVGRLIGQHKSFIAGATERILIANLQRSDAASLAMLVTSISAGMISAGIYSALSGKPLPERPQDWVKEGISKSGVLGWFEEGNNISAKLTRGRVDAFRLIGADKPLARTSNNSFVGQLLGPTVGKAEKLAGVMGDVASGQTSARTIANARQLLPLQNLWATRRLLNEVEDAAANAIGVPLLDRTPKPSPVVSWSQ
jgi:hypothetical protein